MKKEKLIELINSNVISFNNLLLENYNNIGLNETECIVILRLYNQLCLGNSKLDIKSFNFNMTLDNNRLGNVITELVYKGYVNIEMDSINGSEVFNLDGVVNKIVKALNDETVVNVSRSAALIISKIESLAQKEVSSIDCDIINRWVNDYKYSEKEIDDAINVAARNKKVSARYIDRVLANKKKEQVNATDDINALFDVLYGK